MANSAGTVTIDVDVATAKLEAGLKRATQTFASTMSELQASAVAKGAAVGELLSEGIEKGFDAIKEIVEKGVESLSQMDELSQKVGISTETLSALRREASLSGTSFDQLQTGIVKMADSASKSSDVFQKMGINVKDNNGNLKSSQELLTEVAAKFDSYADSSAKTALAVAVFGKSGADMIPFLNKLGSETLPDVIEKTRDAGALMSGDAAKGANEFTENLHYLQTTADDFETLLAQKLTPALNDASKLVKDPEFQNALRTMGDLIGIVADKAVEAAGGLGKFITQAQNALNFRVNSEVTDDHSYQMAATQLSADQTELQSRANGGRSFSQVATMLKPWTPEGIDAETAAGKSTADLNAEIDRLTKAMKDWGAGLMVRSDEGAKAAAAQATDTDKPRTGTAQAPMIGSSSEQAAADAAQKAEQRLQQITNSYLGRNASPDVKAEADFSNALNQINAASQTMLKGGMDANKVLLEQATATQAAKDAENAYLQQLHDNTTQYIKDLSDQTDARKRDIDMQVESISMGDQEMALEKAIYDIREQAIQQQDALDKQLKDHQILQSDYDRASAAVQANANRSIQDQVDGYQSIKDAESNWQNGAIKGMMNYADQGSKAADQVESDFTSMADGINDAIIKFTSTGKINIGSFVESALEDFERLELRLAESSLFDKILSMMGIGTGPLSSSDISSIQSQSISDDIQISPSSFGGGRASGGSTSGGTIYEVAEGGKPELYQTGGRTYLLSGQDGQVTPASSALPASAGSSTSAAVASVGSQKAPTITINNHAGADVSATTSTNSDGSMNIEVLVKKLESQLTSRVNSGKSSLLPALATRMGTSTAGGLS